MDISKLIQQHQSALDGVSNQKTRLWWEKYMKGVISFRGVGIPQNRELLASWRIENGIDKLAYIDQLSIALTFFESSFAEDKLSGILYLQQYLYDKLPWELLLNRYSQLYDNQLIFDWNVCNWFCIRVLGPTIALYGESCAQYIADWKNAPYLWKARSALVPFVNLASVRSYYPFIQEACSVLIQREERFAKTVVGWILRDISKHDQQSVLGFADEFLTFFTKETLNNTLKYFDKEVKHTFLRRLINT